LLFVVVRVVVVDAAEDAAAPSAIIRRPNAPTSGRALARHPPAGAAASARPPAGSRNRGSKYHMDEIESFLDLLEDNLPIGPQEWEDVTEVHNNKFVNKNRDSQSLCRKFNEFVNSKKPTGDPTCPGHIRRAKRIHVMIIDKSDSGGNVLNNDELGFDDNNEDGDEDTPLVPPQNLFPATTDNNLTGTVRSMVTPRGSRRSESGNSSGNIASVLDVMVANMVERPNIEARQREESLRDRREEREERREERKAEQEQRREEMKAEQEQRREEMKAEQELRKLLV
jgi:hypothetical protein